MKISIYGACPEPAMIAELVKHIPEGTKEVVVQSHARKPLGIKECQHPGVLFMDASLDDKAFLHMRQDTVTSEIQVKRT